MSITIDAMTTEKRARYAIGLLIGVVVASLAYRFAAIFTEAINWDEFGLLGRAYATLATGVVHGAGRPGLAAFTLMPFVQDCTNPVDAAVQARIAWWLITLAYLVATYFLVRNWLRYSGVSRDGQFEGLVAMALLALTPAFLTWSIQVRTDQLALSAAVLGGALLLLRHPAAGLSAGVLMGASLLSTQKGVYAISLTLLLFTTGTLARLASKRGGMKKEAASAAIHLALAGTGAAMTILAYLRLVPEAAGLASGEAVGSAWGAMQWARDRIGFRAYLVEAPKVLVHWVLLAGLAWATAQWIRTRANGKAPLFLTSWLVLALGVAVAVFHGAGYPYFLMTTGLFAAVGLGLAASPIADLAGTRRPLVIVCCAVLLALKAWPDARMVLKGAQDEQRKTFDTLANARLDGYRGYSVESALFCSNEPEPLPTMYTREVAMLRSASAQRIETFIHEFRRRPIAYYVASHRMEYFPSPVKTFWREHYVHHSDALYVAGFEIGTSERTKELDVIVPGRYVWLPARPDDQLSIVGGTSIEPGATIELQRGRHLVQPARSSGRLMLDIGAATSEEVTTIYDLRQLQQIRGQL